MRNRSVPRSEWLSFFRGFSQRHRDELVTIRILSEGAGSQVQVRDLPLEGIVASPEGSDPIAIHIGGSGQTNVEHEVRDPRQVWVELSEEGGEEAVAIESQDGTKTIVQFGSAVSAPASQDRLLGR